MESRLNTQEVLDSIDGLTYRQLNVWTVAGYLGDDRKRIGQGRARDYTTQEVDVLRRMFPLVRAGVRPEIASKIALGDVQAYDQLANAALYSAEYIVQTRGTTNPHG